MPFPQVNAARRKCGGVKRQEVKRIRTKENEKDTLCKHWATDVMSKALLVGRGRLGLCFPTSGMNAIKWSRQKKSAAGAELLKSMQVYAYQFDEMNAAPCVKGKFGTTINRVGVTRSCRKNNWIEEKKGCENKSRCRLYVFHWRYSLLPPPGLCQSTFDHVLFN